LEQIPRPLRQGWLQWCNVVHLARLDPTERRRQIVFRAEPTVGIGALTIAFGYLARPCHGVLFSCVMTRNRMFALIAGIVLAASAAAAQSRSKKAESPDVQEMRDYRLNMDVIQRYMQAFKNASNDAGAKKCFEKNPPGNAPSLDAGEKLINACPAAVASLNSAGIKPREFLVITGALIGDFMAVGMKKSGTIKEYPSSISPENAAFIEQNYDKLQGMLSPLMGSQK